MHFSSCVFSFHVHESRYNVNIKILICQIIGPAAAGSAGPVPTSVNYLNIYRTDLQICSVGRTMAAE